ncbi:MAG TPA: multiprotein bridging factor aMBF1 [Methanomassiliicoccales archaeon]|nr:multiprotein bridging factor aMBF1 [Methanomassiliicoccales archaeon]
MPCELCGNETGKLTAVMIEGTQLKVCGDCAKFGDGVKAGGKDAPNRIVIQSRLENRERRMKTKDVYQAEEQVAELVEDYAERVRHAREGKGWKQEELAIKMSEKLSLVQKVERGDMRPDDALIKKLEKTLNIQLIEKVPLIKPEKKAMAGKGLTLEDFIRTSKK